MISYKILIRRVHLYLGLLLILFFVKYGVSGFIFSHGIVFNEYYKDKPQWVERFDKPYDLEIPENPDMREIGRRILDDHGFKGSYGAWWNGNQRIAVNTFSFLRTTRFLYYIEDKRIVAEDKIFRWDHFLTKFHWIGGYQQERLLHDGWAFMIDLVCFSMVIWVLSGIYMWWQNKPTRLWGSVALSGGFLTFIIILIAM